MSVKAYLLCKVRSGDERESLKKVAEFPNVIEACIVFGEYDLVVKLRAKNLNELDFLTEEIRQSVQSIMLSFTAIIAREYKGKNYQ